MIPQLTFYLTLYLDNLSDISDILSDALSDMGLSENSVPLHPMVLLIIIPTKWLFHWGYTSFSDIPTYILTFYLAFYFLVSVRVHAQLHPELVMSFWHLLHCRQTRRATRWGPPVIRWFMNPINYSCRYHKP